MKCIKHVKFLREIPLGPVVTPMYVISNYTYGNIEAQPRIIAQIKLKASKSIAFWLFENKFY